MIQTYKCDRCGFIFKPSLNTPKYKVCEYVGDGEFEDVDLCPACERMINMFMKDYEEDGL